MNKITQSQNVRIGHRSSLPRPRPRETVPSRCLFSLWSALPSQHASDLPGECDHERFGNPGVALVCDSDPTPRLTKQTLKPSGFLPAA